MEGKMMSRKKQWAMVLLFVPLSMVAMIASNFVSMFLESPALPYNDNFISDFAGLSDIVSSNKISGEGRKHHSVYIPGAGFSGFFFTLGRLHTFHKSISLTESKRGCDGPDISAGHDRNSTDCAPSHEYYCFSAGCLALVATLMDHPLDFSVNLANSSRYKFFNGEIGRYDVVEDFVDGLLFDGLSEDGVDCSRTQSNTTTELVDGNMRSLSELQTQLYHQKRGCSEMKSQKIQHEAGLEQQNRSMFAVHKIQEHLSKINVITSVWDGGLSLSKSIRKPTSVSHLKEMLVQTTWIPFVTGSFFPKADTISGKHHSDGAFAGLLQMFGKKGARNQHQSKDQKNENNSHQSEERKGHLHNIHSLRLPWNFDLISNGLNIFFSHEKALQFWEAGVKQGVE